MRHIGFSMLLTAVLSPGLVQACSAPQVQNAFDAEAPAASDIVAVQVQSLALEPHDPRLGREQHLFRAKLRVLKHYRGTARFIDLTYRNSRCAGLRLDVGGIYLIATDSAAPTIELSSHAAPILHLAGFFSFDPDLVLRLSDTIEQLEAALRGERSFAITTPEARQDMSIYGPPPAVPPP